jgi:hypothetical protein
MIPSTLFGWIDTTLTRKSWKIKQQKKKIGNTKKKTVFTTPDDPIIGSCHNDILVQCNNRVDALRIDWHAIRYIAPVPKGKYVQHATLGATNNFLSSLLHNKTNQ